MSDKDALEVLAALKSFTSLKDDGRDLWDKCRDANALIRRIERDMAEEKAVDEFSAAAFKAACNDPEWT